MADTLLIIEDETLLGTELQRYYRRKGWDVEWAQTTAESERFLLKQDAEPLVVLSDMNLRMEHLKIAAHHSSMLRDLNG